MLHCHLNHSEYTLAAIDSVSERGSAQDWRELRETKRTRPELIAKIARVCEAQRNNAYSAELYAEWATGLRLIR